MIDAGARGYRLRGTFRAVEAFKCRHCRRKFRAGSSVVFYPDEPDWQWGCESCGQMWAHVLKDASARDPARAAEIGHSSDGGGELPIEIDWGDEARQSDELAADCEPLAHDAAPDLDY